MIRFPGVLRRRNLASWLQSLFLAVVVFFFEGINWPTSDIQLS